MNWAPGRFGVSPNGIKNTQKRRDMLSTLQHAVTSACLSSICFIFLMEYLPYAFYVLGTEHRSDKFKGGCKRTISVWHPSFPGFFIFFCVSRLAVLSKFGCAFEVINYFPLHPITHHCFCVKDEAMEEAKRLGEELSAGKDAALKAIERLKANARELREESAWMRQQAQENHDSKLAALNGEVGRRVGGREGGALISVDDM